MKSMTEKDTKTETTMIIEVHIIKNSIEIDKEIAIMTKMIVETINIKVATMASTKRIMLKAIINKIIEKTMVILAIKMALIMAIMATVQIGRITKTMIEMETKTINIQIMIGIETIPHIPKQDNTKVLQIRKNKLKRKYKSRNIDIKT